MTIHKYRTDAEYQKILRILKHHDIEVEQTTLDRVYLDTAYMADREGREEHLFSLNLPPVCESQIHSVLAGIDLELHSYTGR